MNEKKVSRELLAWYGQNARMLPWRGTHDPYRVWISEVMLQQTRVETVIPYYQRWLVAFPDIFSLAAADEQQVLQIWEGLGYYSRARNLLKTARRLVECCQGQFPETITELKKLPGIGDYIAGALASIALGQNEVALDGNGLRVVARWVELDQPVNRPGGKVAVRKVLQTMLPHGRAGDFNQALMDLGATVCLPGKPLCDKCPLQKYCLAFLHDTQATYPLRAAKAPVPQYDVAAAVIRRGDCVLIDKRRADGLLGGLWEFPGGKREDGESMQSALERELMEELGVEATVGAALGTYRHAYTHFKVVVTAFAADILNGEPQALAADEIEWAAITDLENYPMGKVDRLIARSLR